MIAKISTDVLLASTTGSNIEAEVFEVTPISPGLPPQGELEPIQRHLCESADGPARCNPAIQPFGRAVTLQAAPRLSAAAAIGRPAVHPLFVRTSLRQQQRVAVLAPVRASAAQEVQSPSPDDTPFDR